MDSCWHRAVKTILFRVWDVQSGTALRTFAGHTAKITSLRFSRDARWLLSIADDKTARLWSLESSAVNGAEFFRTPVASDQLTSGAFSPDGRTIGLSASPDPFAGKKKDGGVWLLDRRTRRIAWEQRTAEGVKSVEFNPSGNTDFSSNSSAPGRGGGSQREYQIIASPWWWI